MPVADDNYGRFCCTKSESRNPVEIGFARIKPPDAFIRLIECEIG
jgi:hypothetical protein